MQGVSTFTYGPFDRLASVTGPDGPATTIDFSYLSKGRIIETDDPNATVTTRQLDAFGRTSLVSRVVRAGTEDVSFTYDAIDRVATRAEPEGTTVWTYDAAPNGLGAVHTIVAPSHSVTHHYDIYGRLAQVDEEILGAPYSRQTQYDSQGRVLHRDYPTGLRMISVYNPRGYPLGVVDDEGTALWTADALDADGSVVQMTAGNGVVTRFARDPVTRRLQGIQSGLQGGSEVLDLGLGWDPLGRVGYRTDGNRTLAGGEAFVEDFEHDDLNRLKTATILGGSPLSMTFSPGGRILTKSDVGTYDYGGEGAGPDQLSALTGLTTTSFSHDDKGNVTSGLEREVTFTSYDRPSAISTSSSVVTFEYGADRHRIRQTKASLGEPTIVTTYVGQLFEERRVLGSSSVEAVHYVFAAGLRVAALVVDEASYRTTTYLHQDHIGSIAAVTGGQGEVAARYYYDAYGRDVDELGQPIAPGQRGEETARGFTDHEHLDDVALIHANARVLDPRLGRFLSPDPVLRHHLPQSIGPYSYVRNRPLALTDPTGKQDWWGIDPGAIRLALQLGVPPAEQPDCNYECRKEDGGSYMMAAGKSPMGRWRGDARIDSMRERAEFRKHADGSESEVGGRSGQKSPDTFERLHPAELEGVSRVREAAHPGKEFSSEIHQRSEGGYEVTSAKEGKAHSAEFTVVRTMVTIVHSHTSDAGLGHERGSKDWNTATRAPLNVITVFPGGAVSRIDTRGNVSDLRGETFVQRP